MLTILFLCPGNTCRSPMAAAITQDQLGEDYVCISAGFNVGEEDEGKDVANLAVGALEKIGCKKQIADPKVKMCTEEMIENSNMVFCLNKTILEDLKEEFPEYVNKFFRYAPNEECVPDPYDQQGFNIEAAEKYERRTPEAYNYVANLMKNIYSPEVVEKIKSFFNQPPKQAVHASNVSNIIKSGSENSKL